MFAHLGRPNSRNALLHLHLNKPVGRLSCSFSTSLTRSVSARSRDSRPTTAARTWPAVQLSQSRCIASTTPPVDGQPEDGSSSTAAGQPDPMNDILFRDTANPLILNTSHLVMTDPSGARFLDGMPGTVTRAEVYQFLVAALRIGAYFRAEAIIRRLFDFHPPWSAEILHVCNLYLRYRAEDLVKTPDSVGIKALIVWFERDVIQRGVSVDGTSLALVSRAVISSLPDSSRDRTLRRFLEIAHEKPELLVDLLNSGEFSEQEWPIINTLIDDCLASSLVGPPAEPTEPSPTDEAHDPTVSSTLNSEPAARIKPDPKIMSTKQKGIGIESMKKMLEYLNSSGSLGSKPDTATSYAEPAKREKSALEQKQEDLELGMMDVNMSRWRSQTAYRKSIGVASQVGDPTLQAIMVRWYYRLCNLLEPEWERMRATTKTDDLDQTSTAFQTFLLTIPHEDVALIVVTAAMHEFACGGIADGVTLLQVTNHVGASLARHSEALHRKLMKKKSQAEKDRHDHRFELWQEGNRELAVLVQKRVKSKEAEQAEEEARQAEFPPKQTEPSDEDTLKSAQALAALNKEYAMDDLSRVSTAEMTTQASFEWPSMIETAAGAHLMTFLMQVATIQPGEAAFSLKPALVPEEFRVRFDATRDVPAMAHYHEWKRGCRVGMIRAHPAIVALLSKEPPNFTVGTQLPMLCKPEPWLGFRNGGYRCHPTRLVRHAINDDVQHVYTVAATRTGDLQTVLDSLNVIGQVGWRVNGAVLDTMIELWNTGEAVADLPPLNWTYAPLDPPSSLASKEEQLTHWRLKKELQNKKTGYHSERCYHNMQLEAAKAFRGKVFYTPHNIDFRGRAYPLPTYLNHMGADKVRGLMLFAEGRPLGDRGLYWLKAHLANVYGFDKATNDARVKFAEDNLEEIADSVMNPITGRRWWVKAEDPWQCLATCIEIHSALQLDDPTTYVCHLPVHQDGSCNGLQHYAALGGDIEGAKQVNLIPSEVPSDIYSGVANLVREFVKQDVAQGHPVAPVMVDRITRKLVKQPVMTNVYGVTFIGARDQVQKQIDEVMPNMSECDYDNWVISAYIARRVFDALGEMFSKATLIQNWFDSASKLICVSVYPEQIEAAIKHFGKEASIPGNKVKASEVKKYMRRQYQTCMVWTTPLKLPVVQPYREAKGSTISTKIQSLTHLRQTSADPVSSRKQKQGFPPNFVHSLDASHMMLTSLACNKAGLTFAAVHDSFWTHACDIDKLSVLLRQEFVRMHADNVIERLRDEFLTRYANAFTPREILRHSNIGAKIRQHQAKRQKDKENSVTGRYIRDLDDMADELLRSRLLRSSNPEDQAAGRKMVTPASIFLSASAEEQHEALLPFTADKANGLDPKDQKPPGSDAGSITQPELPKLKLASTGKEKEPEEKIIPSLMTVWMPFSLPHVPERGDLDVNCVNDSTYFFS